MEENQQHPCSIFALDIASFPRKFIRQTGLMKIRVNPNIPHLLLSTPNAQPLLFYFINFNICCFLLSSFFLSLSSGS
jgi:hypothetical protein